MGAFLRLFLRLFLMFQTALGFPTVLLLVFLQGGWRGAPFGPLQWSVSGLIVYLAVVNIGLGICALDGALVQISAVRKLGVPVTDENLKTNHQRTITLALPFEATFSLCLWSIRSLEHVYVEEETDLGQGVILVTQDPGGWGWGKRIRFDLTPAGDSGTTVRIRIRPRFPFPPLIDKGRNMKHVLAIVDFLTRHADNVATPACYTPVTGQSPTDGVN